MTQQSADQLFEQRFERWLRELADEAVRPFDAVAIAHTASERNAPRRIFGSASMPLNWRMLLLVALLAIGAVGVGIVGGFIQLPNNPILPNPSYRPFSPPPTPLGSVVVVTPAPGQSLPTTPLPTFAPSEPPPTEAATPTPSESAPPTTTLEPSPSAEVSLPPTPAPTESAAASPTVGPVQSVVAVTMGDTHACALADDGRIFCWGWNDSGQLGDGTNDYRDRPTVSVVGIDDGRAIAAGIRFSCAVRADGSVWCWGEDPGSDDVSNVPFQVPGIDDATAVTAGGAFACALRVNAQVACWGVGQAGQLGNGVYENNSGVPSPQAVLGIDDAIAVSAGWGHACALRADGSVWCWGANGDGASAYGSLGDGTQDLRRATPAPVVGLDSVVAIAAGGWSACAVRSDGTVWCWGHGERGTLGDGNFTNSAVPVQVTGIDDARLLALGDFTGCVSRADDSVWCWGQTNWMPRNDEPPGTPREGNKPRDLGVTALANDQNSVFIDTSGQVWWWGAGTNQAPEPWPVGP